LFDLAVHGKTFLGKLTDAWVFIQDGKIALVSNGPAGKASATLELDNSQFLIPAATDLHVHLRDWSQSEKETVETGTKSALAGGVTTVAEMPNTVPKLESARLVEARADLLREHSYTDHAIHAAPPKSPDDFMRIREAGAFALKLYPPDLPRLKPILKHAASAGLRVVVHAEESSMVAPYESAGAEPAAVNKILGQVGRSANLRFAHVSTPTAAEAIAATKRTHHNLTIEVAPHHLFMDAPTATERVGAAAKVNPQLRSRSSARAMVRLLREGRFDFYATDHAPHTVDDKLAKGAPGFPGLEIALPLFLTKTNDLALVCKMYCEAPAAYLGLKKGVIAPGYSADLVVVSRRNAIIDPESFVSKGRVTPFGGEELHYAVDQVFLRGSSVFNRGRFFKRPTKLVRGPPLHR
jgi:dihydroorotase